MSLDAVRRFAVDRASPVPLYFQVAQFLQHAIEAGDIPNGTLFENEIQLAAELGVSRPTMRRAMADLVDSGLVVRRRGVGTRVVQPTVRRPLELTSLHDDLAGSGQAPTTTVLELDVVEADVEQATALGLSVGAPVLKLVRLRSALGSPIAKLTNYLPDTATIDAADLEQHGLYDLLRARGVQLHRASQQVGARRATPAEARLLGEPTNAALLTMQRTAFDDHGVAVEFGSHIYAASRYSFTLDLLSP